MTEESAREEALLVRRLAAGGDDAQAWKTFVDGYGPLLQGLARRMLSRRAGQAADADVDEIVAEVFLALLRHDRRLLERYDPTYRLSTYLGVLCRTAVLRHLRRRGRDVRTLPVPDEVPETRPSSPERAERAAGLREALLALPDRDRLLLTLRFLEGLDYASIGLLLDVREGSVGPLLARAKERLAARCPALVELLEPGAGAGA